MSTLPQPRASRLSRRRGYRPALPVLRPVSVGSHGQSGRPTAAHCQNRHTSRAKPTRYTLLRRCLKSLTTHRVPLWDVSADEWRPLKNLVAFKPMSRNLPAQVQPRIKDVNAATVGSRQGSALRTNDGCCPPPSARKKAADRAAVTSVLLPEGARAVWCTQTGGQQRVARPQIPVHRGALYCTHETPSIDRAAPAASAAPPG